MPNRPLSGVRACVFDAYGTLFDFASAARSCADVLGDAAERVSALWRDKQLQYTWLRAAPIFISWPPSPPHQGTLFRSALPPPAAFQRPIRLQETHRVPSNR